MRSKYVTRLCILVVRGVEHKSGILDIKKPTFLAFCRLGDILCAAEHTIVLLCVVLF